jgi:hypothetical protein
MCHFALPPNYNHLDIPRGAIANRLADSKVIKAAEGANFMSEIAALSRGETWMD